MYGLLEDHFGDLGWWPAKTGFEVIVGAVLTQNTAWRNVETAIAGLKKNRLISPSKIIQEKQSRLSRVIRSSGYHRVKSLRLKAISEYIIRECNGDLNRMKRRHADDLRKGLLAVKGVGPETADSILLYAFKKPVFVVDAYTKRIFSRHGLVSDKVGYDDLQSFVHNNFDMKVPALNQFHAFLVETAKQFCRKNIKKCDKCPLGGL